MQNAVKLGTRTLAVHGGEAPDPTTKASAPNLVMSTTFMAEAGASFSVEGLKEDAPFVYTRWANPTTDQLERKLMLLEQAEACVVCASGMAAIAALLFHALAPGDHLIVSDIAYAGVAELTNDLMPQLGIKITKVNLADLEQLRAAMRPATKLVLAETPCNPILRLTDIEAVAEIAHAGGAKLAVDSTFATPIATRPLLLGADIVIHSLTKYIGGHGDALGGALLGAKDDLARLRQRILIHTGGVMSPFNAWLIMRGLATLPLRMAAHQQAAMAVATFLEQHPKVLKVIYPGLASHPQHKLARRQMHNFAGMIAFQVADGPQAARLFAEKLAIIHYAVSLGHHRSLLFYLPTDELMASSFKLSGAQLDAYRQFAGDGLFRLSVGIEDADDLCNDLARALDCL